jgi:hypothetical protein
MKITFEFATQDDCLDRMVPSDLRVLVAQRDRLQARLAMLEDFVADAQVDALRALDPDYVPKEVESAMVSLLERCKTITREDDPDDIEPGAFITRKQAEAVHASRQEGEPIGFLQSSGVSQLSGGHPAKLYPIGATPSPFESSTFVYTHPASAAPDEEYLRALQDAFDIIQADANTKENYESLCRIGGVLARIKSKQEQGQ